MTKRKDVRFKEVRDKSLHKTMNTLVNELSSYGCAAPVDSRASQKFKSAMKRYDNDDIVRVSYCYEDGKRQSIVTMKPPYRVKKIDNWRVRIYKEND